MKTRRAFLFLVCSISWAADPRLDFVQISDPHLVDLGGVEPQLAGMLANKKDARAHLESALNRITNSPRPDFVLITGDLIDAYSYDGGNGRRVAGPLELFRTFLTAGPLTIFPALGNHDLSHYRREADKPRAVADESVAAEAREKWMQAIPQFRDGAYYSFHRQVGRAGYLFLVLDDGEADGRNPAYAAVQLAWIKRQIGSHPADTVIVAMHIPMPMAPIAKGLKQILADAPNVALLITGHRHTDGIEQIDLGNRRITQVLTAGLFLSADNWRRYRLDENGVQVSQTGKPEVTVATVPVAVPAAR